MRYIFLFLITTVLGACSTIAVSPEKKAFGVQMEKWVGRPVDDLVALNGPPVDIFMRDSGVRIFEYVHKQEEKVGKEKPVETRRIVKNNGVVRIVPVTNSRKALIHARELESMSGLAPEVPASVGSLSWQMDHTKQYSQYSHKEITLGCNILFSVSAANIIERWSLEGKQCD